MNRIQDQQRSEFERALRASEDRPLIEPSDDELRNGWTPETLTAYIAEQNAAASLRIDPKSAMNRSKPVKANSRYSPFKWRRR